MEASQRLEGTRQEITLKILLSTSVNCENKIKDKGIRHRLENKGFQQAALKSKESMQLTWEI